MSTSGDLQQVVKRILLKYGMNLKQLMMGSLPMIAGYLLAEGLIEDATERRMTAIGLERFNLASDLLDACKISLEVDPEETFPKFIAVLKRFQTLEKIAKKMEDDFKNASMSWCILVISKRLCLVMVDHVQ